MKTIFDPKPLKIVIEGSHNGACFELDVFSRNQDWQINWLDTPEDYPGPGKVEERAQYDERIYNAYKARHGENTPQDDDNGQFIVLETLGTLCIATDEDGEPLIFDSRRAADEYAEDIQQPIIVRI